MDAEEARNLKNKYIEDSQSSFDEYVTKGYDTCLHRIKLNAQYGETGINCTYTDDITREVPKFLKEDVCKAVVEKLKSNNYQVIPNEYRGILWWKKPNWLNGFMVYW